MVTVLLIIPGAPIARTARGVRGGRDNVRASDREP